MFHVPVNIWFNLDAAVFDIILLIFLEKQYGNTTSHSKAFRRWLVATIDTSILDAPLRIVFTTHLISSPIRIICYILDFILVEIAMVMMLCYAYLYYKEKKNPGSKVLILAGIITALCISEEFFSKRAVFVICFSSFLLYIIFLAVESRDYRQIKILMERVENENKEAKVETESKEKLFSDVSEKISIPLHMIRVDAMHIDQVSGRSQTKEYVRQILSSSEMLGFLINDIFDMVDLNGKELELNIRRFHLSEILNDIRNMMSAMAEQKGLALEVVRAPGTPDVWEGDDDRLRQILINIIGNGIKYTEEGGVKVHASQNEKGELVFAIADTGIGIKKEDLPYLFTKYRRFDSQKNRHIQGTGLGLSIVSSLVKRMDGKIDVKSVYGNGTKFTVSLPLTEGSKLVLKRGSFLDTTAGLSYFGESIGDYRAALSIFLDHAPQLEQELKGLYGQPAIDVYNICHPLAYFALNIGAMELADRAFKNQRGDTPKQTMDEVIPVFNETVYRVREYVDDSKFM
ncbi:MAG: HAMP domain-containing sensor histidine kinase [Lachnospiraceae bacterium]|nr:HAMP domain-containing sensor histidine kinase [Lachnospiraceae bacterium]